MNKENRVSDVLTPIERTCSFCDKPAAYNLKARGFFIVRTEVLCKRHAVDWNNGTLNI